MTDSASAALDPRGEAATSPDAEQAAAVSDTPAAATAQPGAEQPIPPSAESGEHATFNDFPIGPEIRKAIDDMGYTTPTAVQSAVIGVALEDKDLVVQSKTGSGKTSAFGIPLVEKLEGGAAESGAPLGLVLVPTRELATQVAAELSKLGAGKGVKVHAVYGGVSLGKQASALKDGVDIVVGTPGRLKDHIRRKNMTLDSCRIVCLDEADEMLSMGFWDDVTELLKMAKSRRQTWMFSATLPYEVAKAAAEFLREPAKLDLSGDVMTVEGIANQVFHVLPDVPKPRQLLYLLETALPKSALIFCNTRNETEMIAKYLTQAGFVAEPISGNFRQSERERVMARIKNNDLKYMVATDVASRGIDISHLTHVINYSLPEFTEVYVHRVGRTGRAGNIGTAISLVDGKGLTTLSQLQHDYGIKFEDITFPPEEEVLKKRSQRIMQELSEKASVAEVGQHLEVAKEIQSSTDGAQVIAFLLKQYFNQQANPPRKSKEDKPRAEASARGERADRSERSNGEEAGRKRRRRRRRRGKGRDNNQGFETLDATEVLARDGLPPPANPNAGNGNGSNGHAPLPEAPEGMALVRVNIGFDDGFKGRGAVAKKISALAGLNDGIVVEVESKRQYAVLQAAPDIAELLIERVDGAQIGKKIVSVSAS